jgi:hypothetical protein
VLGPLAFGAYRANYAFSHFGPAAVDSWSRPWYLLSITALFFLVLIALNWLRKSHHFIAIHHNGLHLALPHQQSLTWDQIAGIAEQVQQEVFLGLPLRTHSCAVIYPVVGKPVQIHSFDNLPSLIALVKAHFYPHLLPGLKGSYNAGQWLHFGPVSVQSGSCRIGSRQVPWERVRQVAVRSGDLVVELENQTKIRLPASEIPNLEILLQIIQTGVAA